FFKAQNFARCIPLMGSILSRESNAENVINLVLAWRNENKPAEALKVLRQHEAQLEGIEFHSLMTSCLVRLGHIEEAIRHGDETLRLKDEKYRGNKEFRSYVTRNFNIETPLRNVIAFSVFGTHARYLAGAINNAIVARYLYPGWTVRVYTDP